MKIVQIAVTLLLSCWLLMPATAKPPAHAKGEALPPGLQKNVARGKPLPPGWQKKLAVGDVLDADLYARGEVVIPVGDNGIIAIKIEGTVLRLEAKTRKILKIDI